MTLPREITEATGLTQLINATDLGKALNLSRDEVLRLYRRRAIPAEIAEGRCYRFDLQKVKSALAERANRTVSG